MTITNKLPIIFWLLWLQISNIRSRSASVNLILNPNKNWTSIVCLPTASVRKIEQTQQTSPDTVVAASLVQSPSNDVRIQCRLVQRDNTLVDLPYHFSLFVKLDSNAIAGCEQADDCFSVKLAHVNTNLINIHATTVKPCFTAILPFRYELRQSNRLISNGVVDAVFSRKPKPPTRLKFRTNGSRILSIDGVVTSPCRQDVVTSRYFMTYNVRGGVGAKCQTRNQSSCHISESSTIGMQNSYVLSCPLYTACDPIEMCSAIVTAHIVGVNSFNEIGEVSRKFSKSLAFITSRPTSPNISAYSLNSLTVVFHRPVSCSAAHQHFQYKITYKKTEEMLWTKFHGKEPCSSTKREYCSAYLDGLEMSSNYLVCVAYRNIFDISSSFSDVTCTNASTARLPCKAPFVYQITPIKIDEQFWKASVYWQPVTDSACWNDKLEFGSAKHYYLVELNDGNVTENYRMAAHINRSLDGISFLRYHHEYFLTLSSCNMYGCLNGPKNYLHINRVRSRVPATKSQTQTVTETVLICVLSILFLTASTFLYFILKKRKQFQRLKMKRKLRAEDIQLVREVDNRTVATNAIVSRGTETITTNTYIRKQPCESVDEHQMIRVDTRPLLTRKTSAAVASSLIPENSTLV